MVAARLNILIHTEELLFKVLERTLALVGFTYTTSFAANNNKEKGLYLIRSNPNEPHSACPTNLRVSAAHRRGRKKRHITCLCQCLKDSNPLVADGKCSRTPYLAQYTDLEIGYTDRYIRHLIEIGLKFLPDNRFTFAGA